MTHDADAEYRFHRRFDRLGRLYGDDAVSLLSRKRVTVFGLGGVGSFAAEALARSAVGRLRLVDFDEVCVTNVNRQLQALKGTIGRPKAEVLAERLAAINPRAELVATPLFYDAARSEQLLGDAPDFVVDCIDNITAKAHLLAACRERGLKVVSSMGAAAKRDPTRVELADLADTRVCPLARDVRKLLRKKHGFPQRGAMGVTAVFSSEPRTWPRELTYDKGQGFRCVCPNRHPEHTCDQRTLIDGTAAFVTGTFGLVAASHVINSLTAELCSDAPAARSRFDEVTAPEREAERGGSG